MSFVSFVDDGDYARRCLISIQFRRSIFVAFVLVVRAREDDEITKQGRYFASGAIQDCIPKSEYRALLGMQFCDLSHGHDEPCEPIYDDRINDRIE